MSLFLLIGISIQDKEKLLKFLHSRHVPVELVPGSLHTHSDTTNEGVLIAESTNESPVSCRVSLCTIPYGRKAIAPCGCKGSQQVRTIVPVAYITI